ncbi:MAG TPA: extracellular solute-binding protein, partial [Clostridiaceae bacterium]|nr:extracellular solute-binding protein [Clostridiaceae bacterium]
MRKSIFKILSIALILGLIFGLAACGNQSTPGPEPGQSSTPAPSQGSSNGTPKQTQPVTLTVYTWWDITKYEHLQTMKSEFEAQNQDIKLEFVTVPSKYADTMITKLAGGEIPDVMMLAMDQIPRYALSGLLMPLDDLASQEYKDALYPVVKNALTVNGVMYAAARDVTPKVMYLNTKMFRDAGIP